VYNQSFTAPTGVTAITIGGSFVGIREPSSPDAPTQILGIGSSQISARGNGTIASLDVTGTYVPPVTTPPQPPSGDVRPSGTSPPMIVAGTITHLHVARHCLAYVGTGMEATRDGGRGVLGGEPATVGTINIGGFMAGRYSIKTSSASTVRGKDGLSGSLDVTDDVSATILATGRRFTFGRGVTGVVVYRNATGLRDQVVFNTLSDPKADFCGVLLAPNTVKVQTTIGCTTTPQARIIQESFITAFAGPWVPYAAFGVTAADVGPGAMGVHPFTANIVESVPDLAHALLTGDISEIKASHFDRRAGISSGDYQDVVVIFNGLVYATGTNNDNPPLKLELIRLLGGTVFYDLLEPDKYRVEVLGTATAPRREVRIHGLPSYKVSPGAYRVSLRTPGTGEFYPIYCAGSETGINPPQVSPFQFWFHLDAPDHATQRPQWHDLSGTMYHANSAFVYTFCTSSRSSSASIRLEMRVACSPVTATKVSGTKPSAALAMGSLAFSSATLTWAKLLGSVRTIHEGVSSLPSSVMLSTSIAPASMAAFITDSSVSPSPEMTIWPRGWNI